MTMPNVTKSLSHNPGNGSRLSFVNRKNGAFKTMVKGGKNDE